MGSYGGALGYGTDANNGGASIATPSAAVQFNIYNTSSTGFGINSSIDKNDYTAPTSIANYATFLNSGNIINIALSFSNSLLTETLTDTVTNATFTTNYVSNLTALFSGNAGQAYVGFTGSSGGVNATQQISNFSFNSSAGVAGTTPTPIATTGFNSDVIVDSPGDAAQPFDVFNRFAYYSTNDSAVGGVPTNSTITSTGNSNGAKFGLGSGTSNNALMLSTHATLAASDNSTTVTFSPTGTLTLATPAKYSTIGILSASANGSSNVTLTFIYTTGASTTKTMNVNDWFGSTSSALALGRLGVGTNTTLPTGTGPHLSEDYFLVDPTRNLSQITFTDTLDSGTNTSMGIFAVNGIAAVAAPEPGEIAGMLMGGVGLLGLIAHKRRMNV